MFFTQLLNELFLMTDEIEKLKVIKKTIANYDNLVIVLSRTASTSVSLETVTDELGQLREMRDRLQQKL